jgi:hypothetical protein
MDTAILEVRRLGIQKNYQGDIKGCWVILNRLFPREFFWHLNLTASFFGGRGRSRRGIKRTYGASHQTRHASFYVEFSRSEEREELYKWRKAERK